MRVLWLGLALVAGAAAAEPPPQPPPQRAAEGLALIEALETSPLAVVGTIAAPAALDAHGWRANVGVESVLVGRLAPNAPVVITWEELASRPPRFANGERVLVALEPLQAGSLWRQRLGDPAAVVAARAIAQRGAAFLRAPSLGSLSLVEHYLEMPLDVRAGAAGQRLLVALAAEGERALAVSAAQKLSQVGASATVGAEDAADVLAALARADSDDELAGPLLIWVQRRQPVGVVPALDAALAAPGGAPATFVQARGVLGDGIPAERERALLASPSAPHRAAAAAAAGPDQIGRLATLARSDKAPAVRVAALRRLAQLQGVASLDTLLDDFDDEDASVRTAAAQQAAAFGADVVPRLREVAERWPWPASESAVVALRSTNSEAARDALVSLADTHPDSRIRTLAAVALGRGIGHKD